MKRISLKRITSLLLVVLMIGTMLPFSAFASFETENVPEETTVTDDGVLDPVDSQEFEETVLLKQLKAMMEDILDSCLGALAMNEDEVLAVVSGMTPEAKDDALKAIKAFWSEAEEATDAELYFLKQCEYAVTLEYLTAALEACAEPDDAADTESSVVTDGATLNIGAVQMMRDDVSAVTVNEQADGEEHIWIEFPAKNPTRTENGYTEYKVCQLCGMTTDKEVIPALGEASIESFDEFIFNLALLEELASVYVNMYPAKDPAGLVIKYIRTGVDRYNSGSWGIMAGYEDSDFAKFVADQENMINAMIEDGNYLEITGLKDIHNFDLPNGQKADIGHVFGAMDITYYNKGSQNHADVSGWAGDLVDLLEVSAFYNVKGDIESMVSTIGSEYFRKPPADFNLPSFDITDYDGDLDAYYIMNVLASVEYGIEEGDNVYSLTEIFANYMTEDLTDEYRAAYFMTNRLNTNGTRAQIRNAVYTEYLSNKLISTLEGTRDLSRASDIISLRRAVCYAFADHICKLAGDYVETITNPYYTVFSSTTAQLAPGVIQETHYATSADGKQMVYNIATADITRDDVNVYANYNENDPSKGWEMSRVLDQANAAQKNHGDPNSPNYIPNYNVVASTNADGFNMSTGEPGGLLIMNGKEYHGINNSGFFGITKDGKAVIGTTAEYNTIYKDQMAEAVGGFGSRLIKDGKISINRTESYYTSRASRTAVGITRTGKVVLMVLDGRQEPYSCGGSMEEIAQIMFEAGCVQAINLDGGGSSTFVAKMPGDSELSVINSPSDGIQRSVSDSIMIVSTAPSSTEFDHAIIESEYAYSTIGTPVQLTAKGISPAGNETDLPEGYTWEVSNSDYAKVSRDGVFTGLKNGTTEIYMMLDGEIIGVTTINVVIPETVYFTRTHMDAVYGANTTLPVAASYNNKPVAFNEGDIKITLEDSKYGTVNGFVFVGNEAANIKVVKVTASLTNDDSVCGSIILNMYKQGENTFDFGLATGGNRQFAWLRELTNSTTFDNITYDAVDFNEKMTTSYVFAIDMTQIPIPSQLADLVYMLPGADMENASAWNFLLQLAERVSVLTEITATVDFDDNFIVDISELNIKNEYFSVTSITLDEETNTLTLKLNWIDQTKAIDPATANPLCMVSGMKLTPKDDANWDANQRLSVINSGELGYNAYLRANALYSFAQKKENQEIYGLKPFVNPSLPSESGASFGNTYVKFDDSYTMVYTVKNGWIVEDGGYAYYDNGTKYTGIRQVEGLYYDFGENGVSHGTYTGFYNDAKGVRYLTNGTFDTGWKQVFNDFYYFGSDKYAVIGVKTIGGHKYTFNENGVLIEGSWQTTSDGHKKYFWAGNAVKRTFFTINGDTYYFDYHAYMLTGLNRIETGSNTDAEFYLLDENGILRNTDGIHHANGEVYYVQNGHPISAGLVYEDGYYYYIRSSLLGCRNGTYNIYTTNGYMPRGNYTFDDMGRMILEPDSSENILNRTGIYLENGYLYYYVHNVKQIGLGLINYNGYYYYVRSGGELAIGDYYVTTTNGLMDQGTYTFDDHGRMLVDGVPYKNGVVKEDGSLYLYINCEKQIDKGLVEFEDAYYYVKADGTLAVGDYEVTKTNGLFEAGVYTFEDSGKMHIVKNGIYKEGGYLYYYVNDVKQKNLGLINIDGDFYFVKSNGTLATGKTYVNKPNGLVVKNDEYEFGEDGKMYVIEYGDNFMITRAHGYIYYYVNGVRQGGLGLIKVNGSYFYLMSGGEIATGICNVYTTNGLVKRGNYEFDKDGRMIIPDPKNGIYLENGYYYYYVDDVKQKDIGIIEINGDIYYILADGKFATGSVEVTKTNGLVEAGKREFAADGKMIGDIAVTVEDLVINIKNIVNVKDIFISRGEHSIYRQVADNKIYHITTASPKIQNYSWSYKVDVRGTYTVLIRFTDGREALFTVVECGDLKQGELVLDGRTVTVTGLDNLKVLRYVKGEYHTSYDIKRAPGVCNVTSTSTKLKDGKFTVKLGAGVYSFVIQYKDETFIYYVINVE